ncbi:MAG: MBL fold metallo-hydrolase, partial [PS1 clade bacterium]|nr:MBL fold metallo-hydrolase [PS1 clade bacterium]
MKKQFVLLAAVLFSTSAIAADMSAKAPSTATKAAHERVLERLPFENTEDFKLATRGQLAKPEALVIKDATGRVVWDMTNLEYLDGTRPDTVNPSLWRQARLNAIYGLFEVTEGIYQVRGYDLANVTFIKGDTGWIVVDPLTATETMDAAMKLVDSHFGKLPVKAILATHSHADHFA